MSHLKRLLAVLALLGLAACGGGGGNAGTPGLGGNSSGVADVVIVLSADTIANTGATTVTATVTAVDGNRAGVSGATVGVGVNNNAVVSVSSTTTDASGKVTATIGIGSDKTNRDITVTATAGGVTRTANLKVVTDPNSGIPSANDLTLVLSAPSITNGGSSTITATATAVDSNRNVVAGAPVSFAVDASATAKVSGTVTDASGNVTATVGIGSDRSNRVITVTATAGTLVRTASFAVTGAKLTASASPLVVAGSTNSIEYTLVDFNAIAMVNQTIAVSGSGLPAVTGRTDLNGKFRYTYTAPATTGALSIVATAAGDQFTQSVTVSDAGSGIPPAAGPIQSASVTPTPTVVTVNTVGSTTNQVELRALFVGANNKPIKNVRARFDLAGNSSNTDGVVGVVGTYAYSDDSGIARATFTPGQRSSPTNGVTIRVCYDTVDFASPSPTNCDGVANFATATLTVSSEALAVSIRTNRDVKSGRNDLTFIKEYVVMVVDSAGQAKSDVQITPSVDLIGYYKGQYFWNGSVWAQSVSLAATEKYIWTGNGLGPGPGRQRSHLPERGRQPQWRARGRNLHRGQRFTLARPATGRPELERRSGSPQVGRGDQDGGLGQDRLQRLGRRADRVRQKPGNLGKVRHHGHGIGRLRDGGACQVRRCAAWRRVRNHGRDDPAIVRAQPLRHRDRLHEPELSA